MSDSRHRAAVQPDPRSVLSHSAPTDSGWRPKAGSAAAADGRHARAQRTHQAVLDGLKACLESGVSQPTAKLIAEHAKVSLRGVFRHFGHLDALLLELDAREHQQLIATIRPCPVDGPVEKRIDSFVQGCARLYEGTTIVRRALQRYAAISESLERYRDRQRRHGHEKILTVFAHELEMCPAADRRERIQEISALTSWSQWEELRHYEGLSAARARKILMREMGAILTGPPTAAG